MEFKQTQLKNGLTIIGEVSPNAASCSVAFFVKAGARDETDEVSGVSHFLEHMMFKGTKKRSAIDLTFDLGAIGAQANAFTSEENTVYYASVLPEYFSDVVEILSDMLRPSLDEKEFDIEKNVILEEIALYKDRPTHILFERAMQEHFRDHTAGNSILGTTESITALSVQQMREYFNTRYAAPNIVLAASGNFDWDDFVNMAGRYCDSWPDTTITRVKPKYTAEKKELGISKDDLQLSHCCLIAEGPSAQEEERYPISILSCILGDSKGSRVYWDLVDKGLVESASISTDEMDGTGIIYGYLSAEKENIAAVSEKLQEIMETAADFTEEQLELAKTKIATRLVLEGESSRRRLMAIGMNWIYNSEYSSLEEELKRVKAVDSSSIRNAIKKYSFTPTTRVTLTA